MNEDQIRALEDEIGVSIKQVHVEDSRFAFNTDPITIKQKRDAQTRLKQLGYAFQNLGCGHGGLARRAWVKVA